MGTTSTAFTAKQIRELGTSVLAPLATAGVEGSVNRPLVAALAEHGLLQRLFPVRAGGSQPDRVLAGELCLLREHLAWSCTEAETALAVQGLGAHPILDAGSEETVARWIPQVANGRAIAAFALTEPDAGSDAAALSLTAERDTGGWRLTGTKKWISNAPDADVYTVFARTTLDAGARGVTAFAVDGHSEGVGGAALEMLSPHAIGRLDLDGVFVADADVLGEVDAGFRVAMRTLDLFRPSVGAFAVGMAQAALDTAVAHSGTRWTFGLPLRGHQTVAHTLADLAVQVAAARLLVTEAAAEYDRGGPAITVKAAMAKLFATEAAQTVVDAAVQLHGAAALERGHLLEHLYREVRAPRIYEGTSAVQRTIIARELFREPG